MRLWRLCRRPFADLGGEGARLYGGRWNSPGRPMLYLAREAALAVLEVRVHLDLPPELLPPDYVVMEIEADDGLAVEDVAEPDWDRSRAFGDGWLESRRTPLLSVPSAIVAESRNMLVNPLHPESAGRLRIQGIRPFAFDPRLWLG